MSVLRFLKLLALAILCFISIIGLTWLQYCGESLRKPGMKHIVDVTCCAVCTVISMLFDNGDDLLCTVCGSVRLGGVVM